MLIIRKKEGKHAAVIFSLFSDISSPNSQAHKIGEVDISEDLEKLRNEIKKLEKDLFDLKKDTIACTAPLDGKKEDLLAGTVPTEKCQELPTSTASPEKSTNNLLLDRILASTAPQKSKK